MNALLASVVAPALLFGFAGHALGATIEFVQTGTGSGAVGDVEFSDAAFTITAVGDTEHRKPHVSGFFIDHASATVAIEGVGVFRLITPTRTFVSFVHNEGGIAGFSRATDKGADLLHGPEAAALNAWDMRSSIGPLTGPSTLMQWKTPPVLTHAGALVFENGVAPGTFAARLASSPAPGSSAKLRAPPAATPCGRPRAAAVIPAWTLRRPRPRARAVACACPPAPGRETRRPAPRPSASRPGTSSPPIPSPCATSSSFIRSS